MTWVDFIKYLPAAVVESISLFRDGVKAVQDIAQTNRDKKVQEIRNAQNDLERRIELAEDDAERAKLAKLRDEVRRGIAERAGSR